MKIIYGFSNCTDKTYNELVISRGSSSMQPDQKYHGLLIKGFAENGAEVQCLSGLPINRSFYKKIFVKRQDEREGNARYHYYKTINLPIFRQIMIFFGGLFNGLKIKKSEETFALCDCLNIANVYGLSLACKLKKIPLIEIVTDLPDMFNVSKMRRFVNNRLLKKADGFIFLSKQMNEVVNKKNKPFIVLEGHCDSKVPPIDNVIKTEEVEGKKIVIYAGNIARQYGLSMLVEGVIKANIKDVELHIYGDGDYKEELKEIVKNHENIKYMGVLANDKVVENELQASLLVNPRPSSLDFAKYSFPSKTMEYMVSGTPVLTTKLSGIPNEYFEYVYCLEDETVDGVSVKLKEIFAEPISVRYEKGKSAREFILKNKSNIVQSNKIITFLREQMG